MECKVLPSRMSLRLGGGAPALEGEFEARVNEQVSFWQFEEAADGLRSLVLVLEKKQGAAHWVRLRARAHGLAALSPLARSTCLTQRWRRWRRR